MEYKDTVNGMLSSDYKERFKAEYQQTKIRYEKLKKLNNKVEAQRYLPFERRCIVPDFKLSCSPDLLEEQQHIMGRYLHVLEIRAEVEGIDLGCAPVPGDDGILYCRHEKSCASC